MTVPPIRDLTNLIAQGEGQYLDFKSALHGPPGGKKNRGADAIRDDIAEYVAAFANADGGTLLVGIEDDGAATGCHYPNEKLDVMLAVPQQRLKPPQAMGEVVTYAGVTVLVFDVSAAAEAVMVVGDGFPRRVGDEVVQESEAAINAIKTRARTDSLEADAVSGATLDWLDAELLERAKNAAGLAALSDPDYLVARRLADHRGEFLVLRLGALLLFAKQGASIPLPNCGVRVLHVRGDTRRTGADLNTTEVARLEGALPHVIEATYGLLTQRIRKSTRLHDLFFRETPEYPTFAWQEAVVNAVAHRDYRIQGRGVEVWLYDDRLEVRSPGGLLPSVSLRGLERREMLHESRNPRIARVLAELGLMREQGEGIPRMFEEMERSLLRLPELVADAASFSVTLRNEPIFDSADPDWVGYVRTLPIGDRQRRALVAFQGGRFTSAKYQSINQVDRDQAYRELSEMVELGFVVPSNKPGRGSTYQVVSGRENAARPEPVQVLARRLRAQGNIQNADFREVFGVERDVAKARLQDLVARGVLIRTGERRGTRYHPGSQFDAWEASSAKAP